MMLNILKWSGTFLLCVGAGVNAAGIYPLGVYILVAGSIVWTIAAYIMRDTPLCINNGVILLITIIGLIFGAGVDG